MNPSEISRKFRRRLPFRASSENLINGILLGRDSIELTAPQCADYRPVLRPPQVYMLGVSGEILLSLDFIVNRPSSHNIDLSHLRLHLNPLANGICHNWQVLSMPFRVLAGIHCYIRARLRIVFRLRFRGSHMMFWIKCSSGHHCGRLRKSDS